MTILNVVKNVDSGLMNNLSQCNIFKLTVIGGIFTDLIISFEPINIMPDSNASVWYNPRDDKNA